MTPEIAFDLDQGEHQLRIKPGALRLVARHLQELDAFEMTRFVTRRQSLGHAGQPVDFLKTGNIAGLGRRPIAKRGSQRAAHRIGQLLIDLGACHGRACCKERARHRREHDHAAQRTPA